MNFIASENFYKDLYFSMNELEESITSVLNSKTKTSWYIKNKFTYVNGQKSAKVEYYALPKFTSPTVLKSSLTIGNDIYIFTETSRDRHVNYTIELAKENGHEQIQFDIAVINKLIKKGKIIYLGSKEVPITSKNDFYNLLSDYSNEYDYLDTEKGFFNCSCKYDTDLTLSLMNFAQSKIMKQKTHLH